MLEFLNHVLLCSVSVDHEYRFPNVAINMVMTTL